MGREHSNQGGPDREAKTCSDFRGPDPSRGRTRKPGAGSTVRLPGLPCPQPGAQGAEQVGTCGAGLGFKMFTLIIFSKAVLILREWAAKKRGLFSC